MRQHSNDSVRRIPTNEDSKSISLKPLLSEKIPNSRNKANSLVEDFSDVTERTQENLKQKRKNPINKRKKLNLGLKTILLAIAISAIPVTIVWGTAYYFTKSSLNEQINQTQQVKGKQYPERLDELMDDYLRNLGRVVILATGATIWLVGAIAAYLANRITRKLVNFTEAVEQLGQGKLNTRIPVKGEDELAILGSQINLMANRLHNTLERQAGATKVSEIIAQIANARQIEDLTSPLNEFLGKVRALIKADRVVFYQFDEYWVGTIIAESVAKECPSALGARIEAFCFATEYIEKYRRGRVLAMRNVKEAGLTPCHLELLEALAVKANLVVPVVVKVKTDTEEGELLGLLIAHQCSQTRIWNQSEIDYLKQIANQLAVALRGFALLKQERKEKEIFQQQILKLLNDVEEASNGDLTVRSQINVGEIGIMADFINTILESLRDIVARVKLAAKELNNSVGENQGAIAFLAKQTAQQAERTNQLFIFAEKMTRSIQEVAHNAKTAAEVSRLAAAKIKTEEAAIEQTVESVSQLSETVAETAKKVKRLGESSQEISQVIFPLNQIAMRINLLAINASIEATKAGEEGQGFVMVVEEVGELALQSAAATKEIQQIVENIERETSEVVKAMEFDTAQVVRGTHLVEDTKNNLGQILEIGDRIDSLLESIFSATLSQVQTSQAMIKSIAEITRDTEPTSGASAQVSSSLQKAAAIARELKASVDGFKVEN